MSGSKSILDRAGIPKTQSKVMCMDYVPQAKYDKITCLEMAEHVDMFKITNFLRQCSDLLEDDGIMLLQVARIGYALLTGFGLTSLPMCELHRYLRLGAVTEHACP